MRTANDVIGSFGLTCMPEVSLGFKEAKRPAVQMCFCTELPILAPTSVALHSFGNSAYLKWLPH